MADVYWVARDLSSFFVGNHQFLLVYLEQNESMLKVKTQEESGKKFVTLAGHQPNGNLVYVPNESGDVTSVKESINKNLKGNFQDYDLEKHLVTPPNGTGWSFAIQLELLADKYAVNSGVSPVKYDLWNLNCSTWVNTILKIAGVSAGSRGTLGEFKGIDWGEEELLDENLFS